MIQFHSNNAEEGRKMHRPRLFLLEFLRKRTYYLQHLTRSILLNFEVIITIINRLFPRFRQESVDPVSRKGNSNGKHLFNDRQRFFQPRCPSLIIPRLTTAYVMLVVSTDTDSALRGAGIELRLCDIGLSTLAEVSQ